MGFYDGSVVVLCCGQSGDSTGIKIILFIQPPSTHQRTLPPRWVGTWDATYYRPACPQRLENILPDIPTFEKVPAFVFHSFIHSCISSFAHSFIIPSVILLFVLNFFHSFLYCTFIFYLFLSLFICFFNSFNYFFITFLSYLWFIHSSTHSSIHSFIH